MVLKITLVLVELLGEQSLLAAWPSSLGRQSTDVAANKEASGQCLKGH